MKVHLRILSLSVLAAAALFCSCKGTGSGKSSYQTVTVSPGSLSTTVTATGTIEPINQVEVGAQVSGIISNIYVDYNTVVKQGQLMAEIDRSLLEAELESSQASLASSRSEYEYQQKNFARQKGLWEKKLISDTEYEQAKYNYEKSLSSYSKSKADIIRAEKNLGYSYIYSPIDGVVLSRAVEEGQTVASSFNTPTLFTIANDLRKMRVIADVDEADIGQVEEGQRVVFTVDAFPDDTFEGSVTQVRLLATTTSNVVTYEVVVDAPNPDLKLKPGLTANVTIYTMEKNGVLTVPVRALRFKPDDAAKGGTQAKPVAAAQDAGDKTLGVMEGSVVRPAKVKTGMSDGVNVEIISGIENGAKVIVSSKSAAAAQISDGTPGENNPFMPTPPGGGNRKK